jgi:hypothetical protein
VLPRSSAAAARRISVNLSLGPTAYFLPIHHSMTDSPGAEGSAITRSPDLLETGGLWNPEAEGLRGLEIDDQLKVRRLVDREIARLGALEDLVPVARGVTIMLEVVRAVHGEPAAFRKSRGRAVDRR